jgi:hypothetical protein
MSHAAHAHPGAPSSTPAGETSLDASDEFDAAFDGARYCPTDLLATFTLLMAGHGRCVSAAMMLGDREYAMWQLARGRTVADEELRTVTDRLFSYFDDVHGWGPSLPA